MVLIEGLGDEVTLVLGSFFLITVLLLAWLSTHTDDIPLIREVNLIVVELRQRHRNRQIRTEQPPNVEISQSSRAGVANVEEESGSENSNPVGNSPVDERSSGESVSASDGLRFTDESSSETSAEVLMGNSASLPSNDSAPDEISTSAPLGPVYSQFVKNELGDMCSNSGDPDSEAEGNVIPPASASSMETEEETLRRRRMQYFQSGSPDTMAASDSGQRSGGFSNVTDRTGQQNVSCSKTDVCDNIEHGSAPTEGLKPPVISVNQSQVGSESPQPTGQPEGIEQEIREEDDPLGSRIRVKLKYMNETQRFVYASPADTIGEFRRTHFQSELQDNKWVRFIFNGQDLRDDARTLGACNIENNCTMHCLVTARQRQREGMATVAEDEDESVLGSMMYPLFTLLLLIVWYFRIFYRQYFSAMSTVCLIGISFLLALSYISSLRTSDTNTPVAATQHPPAQTRISGTDSQQNHPHSD